MAELSPEQVASTVLDILRGASPRHEEKIRDAACIRHPRQVTLVMIRQALFELDRKDLVTSPTRAVWALKNSANASPVQGPASVAGPASEVLAGASTGLTGVAGPPLADREDDRTLPSAFEPLTDGVPARTVAPVSGQTQEQLWAEFEKLLRTPLIGARDGVSPDLIVAAHEWSLATPLLIREAKDFKSIPKILIEPFIHQVRAAMAFFRRLNPRGLIADDVGLGKTVTAGLIILELILRRKIQGFAVIAPKMIQQQWQSELREKFNIEVAIATGKDLKGLAPGARIITTYQSAANHLEALKTARIDLVVFDEMHKLRNLHAQKPPKMAVAFHEAQRAQAFRYCLGLSATPLQNSLRDLFSLADLLRTPNPTPYGTLKQFESRYLADNTGRRIKPGVQDEFRRRTSEFMHRTSRKESNLPFPDREVRVQGLAPSLEERALLAEALRVVFGGKSSPFQRIGLAQSILSSPAAAIAAIDGKAPEEAGTGASELRALRQRFSGLHETAKSKALVELVRELQKREPNWRVLIFTIRRATADFVRDVLERAGFEDVVAVMQGGQARANQVAIADFQADPPRSRVLVSTDAGAEGVNLQACNVVINFDLPWNPMIVEQRIGRVQRLGQKAKKVIVYNLVTKGTIEESVVSRLFEKLRVYDAAIGLAEEILGQLTDDEVGFEKVVLDLVEQAVLRGDVEAALEQKKQNADRARQELERQREEIDQAVGSGDYAATGPSVPEIKPAKPSMTDREFWSAAMTASGWTLRERDDGKAFEATRSGRRARRFTFDANHPDRLADTLLGAYAVELVAPDERPFEELVNAYAAMTSIDATTKVVVDVDGEVVPGLERLLAPRVLQVRSHRKAARAVALRAKPVVRVNISVAHDQYEKLVTGAEVSVTTMVAADASAAAPLATPQAAQAIAVSIRQAVEADPDLTAFRAFYDHRRGEEMARVRRSESEKTIGPERAKQLLDDHRFRLSPLVEPRLVCITGEAEEAVRLQLSVLLDTKRSIEVELPILPRQTVEASLRAAAPGNGIPTICDEGHWTQVDGLVLCAAERCDLQGCDRCADWQRCVDCGETRCSTHGSFCAGCKRGVCLRHADKTDDGRTACATCIGECVATHAKVMRTELIAVEDTGELVVTAHAAQSAVTGKWIRSDRAVHSQVSGLPAAPGELVQCSATGKWVLPSELIATRPSGRRMIESEVERCADTGAAFEQGALASCGVCRARVSPGRLVPSEVSGVRAHPEELVRCAVTGKRALPSEVTKSGVSNRVALTPLVARCEVTGAVALPDELATCGETGKRVLRSRLRESAKTGRLALVELTDSCSVCGKTLLKSEMLPCAVTNRLADPACMLSSPISGARALPSAMANCAASGRKVLPSELVECAETHRLVGSDRIATCAFSGERVADDRMTVSAFSNKPVRRKLAEISGASGRTGGPGELVFSRTRLKVLADELDPCPCCGNLAILRELPRHERFECPSCRLVCCALDARPAGTCSLCEVAMAMTVPAEPPADIRAQSPRTKTWFAGRGDQQTVWVGRPGALSFFTRGVLLRATNPGRLLFTRQLG